MKIEFTIPLSKNLLTEGNRTDHWSVKRKRNISRAKWLNAFWKPEYYDIKLPCKVTFTRIAPRLLDYDNWVYTCKHFRDLIADKMIPGLQPGQADSDPRIQWDYKQEKGNTKEYALRIEIEKSSIFGSETTKF